MSLTTPDDRLYAESDLWVKDQQGARYRVGITDFAQDQLGEIVYVDLPKVGSRVVADTAFGEIESNKSVSDLSVPLSGVVVALNEDLSASWQVVNHDPYGRGWLVDVQLDDQATVDHLLSASEYQARRS